MDRATWLVERRRVIEERADLLIAPTYDEDGGTYSNATHLRMLARFLALCPPRARVLDAGCGTGRYWPVLLSAGCSLTGIDQSAGMLARARAKYPDVPVEKRGLQELAAEHAFDGIVCIDALEFIFPEDWPNVAANLHRSLVPGGLLYATVELPEDDLAQVNAAALAAGYPVVPGEYYQGAGYHYYPPLDRAREWLSEAGFDILDEAIGDAYHHVLGRAR